MSRRQALTERWDVASVKTNWDSFPFCRLFTRINCWSRGTLTNFPTLSTLVLWKEIDLCFVWEHLAWQQTSSEFYLRFANSAYPQRLGRFKAFIEYPLFMLFTTDRWRKPVNFSLFGITLRPIDLRKGENWSIAWTWRISAARRAVVSFEGTSCASKASSQICLIDFPWGLAILRKRFRNISS